MSHCLTTIFAIKNKKPARDQTGWFVFCESALTLLDVKETDGFMEYGFLYRVRRSFKVLSLDLEKLVFGWIGTGLLRIVGF